MKHVFILPAGGRKTHSIRRNTPSIVSLHEVHLKPFRTNRFYWMTEYVRTLVLACFSVGTSAVAFTRSGRI